MGVGNERVATMGEVLVVRSRGGEGERVTMGIPVREKDSVARMNRSRMRGVCCWMNST